MFEGIMVKVLKTNDRIGDFKANVACIGYFDCLHIGHQELIGRTIDRAKALGCRSMVICFDPDPMELITGKKQKHILSYDERIGMMEELGIDDITVFRFDESFMKMEAQDFIEKYLNRMNIKELICGFDFTFGYMGKGDSALLKESGSFGIDVVEEIQYDGKKVSSTRIKEEIESGNFRLVSRLLNYDYYLPLLAVKTSQKGSKWLVEAKLEDSDRIVPENIQEIFSTVRYVNGRFIIESDIDVDLGEELTIIFEDE